MAHEMIFSLPRVARAFTRLGVLRGAPHLGAQVLGQLRRDLLVMPGGDRDTWRPFSQRYKVNFAGRKGYARLALQMGVPIVPVAHVGAQHTLLVLSDGSRFARAVGLQKIARASIFPVHISVPWGLTVGPLPHLPLPVRLRYRIGPPVAPPPGPEREEQPSDERVAAYDASVQRAIQGLLDELRAERRGWMRGRLRRMARKLGPGGRR
jgi:1-acyl-sn-glycerol-3-phosphate acyltransferase